jgi:hypothetical protein
MVHGIDPGTALLLLVVLVGEAVRLGFLLL